MLLNWLAGFGTIVIFLLVILIIGYAVRAVIPVDDPLSPLDGPYWELTAEDITASLVIGFCAVTAVVVPLVVGIAIMS